MLFLSSSGNFRNLGNILVTMSEQSKYVAKVADFGMSKVMTVDTDYYKSNDKTIAVKWHSPEVLQYGKFSHSSGNKFI